MILYVTLYRFLTDVADRGHEIALCPEDVVPAPIEAAHFLWMAQPYPCAALLFQPSHNHQRRQLRRCGHEQMHMILVRLHHLDVEVRLLRYVEQYMFHAHADVADKSLPAILAYQNNVVFQCRYQY